MRELKLFTVIAMLCWHGFAQGQNKTVLSSDIYGYKQDLVYYDCIQSPSVTAEFHNNPGEQYVYPFTTRFSPIVMLINGKTEVLMNAGDSVHVTIRQEGKSRNVVYSGSEKAVAANKMRQELRQAYRSLNYKTQLLSCVALDIKPQKRVTDAQTLLETVKTLAAKYQGKADKQLVDYIQAEQEASSYMSLMEYPRMYEEVRHQAIAEQGIGEYWKLMDGVKLREDAAAMMCPDYAGFLIRYCFYMGEKKAVEANTTYAMPQMLEGMYDEVKRFYTGAQRDFALYTLMCNFIRNGKQVERVMPLYKEYKEKYNKNKVYMEVLDQLLQ